MRRIPWILALLALGLAILLLHASSRTSTAPDIVRSDHDEERRRPATLAPRTAPCPGSVAPDDARVSISGHVREPNGAPSSYAVVTWMDGSGCVIAKTRTGALGEFLLHGSRGDGRLRIESRNGNRLEADVDTQDWHGCQLQLKPGRPLDGVVLAEKDRQPVEGAHIHMWALYFGLSTATTDEEGAFRLPAVPVDDDFDVSVEAGAFGRTKVENVVWAEGEPLVVLLPEVRTLRGQVVCALTGRHIEDARVVNAYGVGGSEGGVCWDGTARDGTGAITDDEGRFVYEGITHPGELELHAEGWHLPDGEHRWWGHGDEVVLRVVPRVTVSGTVVDERGNSVAGAEVEIDGAFSEAPVRSDAAGRFAIRSVALGKQGNVLEAKTADLAGWTRVKGRPGHPLEEVKLRLKQMSTVTGTVLDDKGAPLGRAEIHLWWRDERFSRVVWDWTDDEGRFSFTQIDPGWCSVEAEAAGYQNAEADHEFPPGATDVGEIRLKPLLMRGACVVDEDGAPIPSAWWRSRPYASTNERPVADDGTFRFATTREGKFFDLTVGAPDYMDRTLDRKNLPSEDPVVIALRKAHFLEGRLLDLEGRPVKGVRVVCRGERWVTTSWGNRTDMAGRFRVKVGAPGPYFIEVSSEHFFAPDVQIEADAAPVDVRAHPTCSLGGRVVDMTGVGFGNARVSVSSRWEKEIRYLWADAEGRFRVDGILGRTFRVTARCDDDSLTFRPLNKVPANTEDLVLRAEPAYRITGTVVWSDGRPAADSSVDVTPVGHNADWDFEETDENGHFCFSDLPAGDYEMEAWATIEIEDEEDQEEENDLEFDAGKTIVHAGAQDVRLVLRRTPP